MAIRKRTGEKKDEFINRCISSEVEGGMNQDKAVAVCSSIWEHKQLSAIKRMRGEDDRNKKSIINFLEQNELGVDIADYGLTEDDFKKAKRFEVDVENFSSEGIDEDNADDESVGFYRYELAPGESKSSNSRNFCVTMMDATNSGRVFRYEDIVALNKSAKKGKYQRALRKGGGNYSIFKYRGGNNCRHIWVKYKYESNKAEIDEIKNSISKMKKDEVEGIFDSLGLSLPLNGATKAWMLEKIFKQIDIQSPVEGKLVEDSTQPGQPSI